MPLPPPAQRRQEHREEQCIGERQNSQDEAKHAGRKRWFALKGNRLASEFCFSHADPIFSRHTRIWRRIGLREATGLDVPPMKTLLSVGLVSTLLLASSQAENLIENGSFELPKVSGRTPAAKGGNPSRTDEKTSWTALIGPRPGTGKGNLIVGLTDEIAHEGKQSLFVDFEKITEGGQRAMLVSQLLPIQSNKPYRISAWGRLDRERPIALDERRPHLVVDVEFFAADQETQLGSTEYRVQMIPGSIVPGMGTRLLFTAGKWNEYFTEVKSPTDSAFMKVTFNFQVPKEPGETDGILYLDSAAVQGERGTTPLTDTESTDDEDAEEPTSEAKPAAPTPAKGK